jgi:hypothetical protein
MPICRGSEVGRRREYRLVCKGLGSGELYEPYQELSRQPRALVAFRNPFPPHYDSKTIHEIFVDVVLVGAYPAKKFIDLIADTVKSLVNLLRVSMFQSPLLMIFKG